MSTLETALVISAVMLVMTGMIILPADLCAKAAGDAVLAVNDVIDGDPGIISAERLNTFLTGISENYRIIYGSLIEEALSEEE